MQEHDGHQAGPNPRNVLLALGVLAAAISSVAPEGIQFGPEVSATVNEDGGALRTEPSAVLTGDTVVVAWNDSRAGREFKVATGVGIGWSISSNGGRSFGTFGYLPSDETPGGPSGADSWLCTTPSGQVLLQLLHWSDTKQQVQVYALSKKGSPGWTLRGSFSGEKLDKPAMATRGEEWIGVAFSAGPEIRFVQSKNSGQMWSDPVTLSSAGPRTRTGAGIAACGDNVLVVWIEGKAMTLDEVWYASSADGGETFSGPTKARDLPRSLSPPPGYALGVGPAAFIVNSAWVACSDDGPQVFHVTYSEGRVAGSAIVYQQARFGDDGPRWSEPEIVGGGDSIWAIFPSIAVIDGRVGILYYDSRHSNEEESMMDVYLAVGTSDSFEDHRMTTVSTTWGDVPGDEEHAPFQRNFGDYITLAADGPSGLASWTDGRSGQPRIMTRSFRLGESGN